MLISDLLAAANSHLPLTHEELVDIVRTNDKQRFSFDDTGTRIRANQGHSTEVDLQLTATQPPAVLYHGTPDRFLASILQEGLRKMARHHVHLSPDIATATKVGARRGKPVILVVDAAKMSADNHTFFVSNNRVWLVDHVPAQYLKLLTSENP